jgi:glycerophosphoryl diester phosphodiesterase
VLPQVVAHRGASAERPEHTLAAYELAVAQGADGLECDVRLTRDGHLVCVHDRTVNRTSDGRGAVSELSLAELSAFDYGDGNGLLTLADLLELAVEHDVKLFVETKHPVRYGGLVEAKLLATLGKYGLARPVTREDSRVVVMSFSAAAVRRTAEAAPTLPTVLLMDQVAARRWDMQLPPWAHIAGPGLATLRQMPDYVQRCRDRGRDVYVWTVDEPADVRWCADLGVRYLATNSPADTRRTLTL